MFIADGWYFHLLFFSNISIYDFIVTDKIILNLCKFIPLVCNPFHLFLFFFNSYCFSLQSNLFNHFQPSPLSVQVRVSHIVPNKSQMCFIAKNYLNKRFYVENEQKKIINEWNWSAESNGRDTRCRDGKWKSEILIMRTFFTLKTHTQTIIFIIANRKALVVWSKRTVSVFLILNRVDLAQTICNHHFEQNESHFKMELIFSNMAWMSLHSFQI